MDTDGDGYPDVFDSDANGNEVPDRIDPTVPGSPGSSGNGSECSLANAKTCCESIGACTGALRAVALYADGQLLVDDRAVAVRADGMPATVVNAGAGQTNLGVAAKVGSIRSMASVLLRDRSIVDGSLLTSGSLQRHNDTVITGAINAGGPLGFSSLSGFRLKLPSNGPDMHIEPDRTGTLAPGSHGAVVIKSRSTLFLTAGTYFLKTLEVHPQALLSLDMSHGPIYLYVAEKLLYQGAQVTTGGNFYDLFLGYLGTQAITLETAFDGTFVAPHATLNLASVQHPAEFRGAFYARNVELRPGARVVAYPFDRTWISPAARDYVPPNTNPVPPTGGAFTCSGGCSSAVPLSRHENSGAFNTTGERWFVVSQQVNGWQASNVAGRTISVNGVGVSPGQTLPAAIDGKLYFSFSEGGVNWASWSFW